MSTIKASPITDEERQSYATDVNREWIFTFGFGHCCPKTGERLRNKYVRIRGTVATSRGEMERRFGRAWAFQYPNEIRAGVEKYNLTEYFGPDGSVLVEG